MFSGPKYNEFISWVLSDGVPLIEQSADAEPSDELAIPTQKCYIAVRKEQVITFRFKHHKRKPEDKDFMVVLRIDGKEFGRTVIGKNSHHPNNVEHFYTMSVDAEGSQVIHSHTFQIMQARDGDEVFSMQDGEGMGMIKLDVYRGQKIPTPNVSNVVVYQEPTWPRIVKSQETRLCVRPGSEDVAEPSDAVRKFDFKIHPRDKKNPWFSQVYEYRLAHDLRKEGLVTNDPLAAPTVPDIVPKGRQRHRTSPGDTARLEARIATLEGTINGFMRNQNHQVSHGTSAGASSASGPVHLRTPVSAGPSSGEQQASISAAPSTFSVFPWSSNRGRDQTDRAGAAGRRTTRRPERSHDQPGTASPLRGIYDPLHMIDEDNDD